MKPLVGIDSEDISSSVESNYFYLQRCYQVWQQSGWKPIFLGFREEFSESYCPWIFSIRKLAKFSSCLDINWFTLKILNKLENYETAVKTLAEYYFYDAVGFLPHYLE